MENRSNIGFIESCDVPSVYSNKQSFYEVLTYINYKLNELIDVYNTIEMDYKTYVDGQLNSVKEYADNASHDAQTNAEEYANVKATDTLDNSKKYTDTVQDMLLSRITNNLNAIKELNTKLSEANNKITNETTQRQTEDNKLDEKITQIIADNVSLTSRLEKLINNNKSNMSYELAEKIGDLKVYIDTHYLETTTTMNPWQGKNTTFQEIVNDVFRVYRPLSMTVTEIETVLPEILSIDDYGILTVGDLDFNGLRVKQYLSDAYVFSAVTGKYIPIQDAYYELINVLTGVVSTPNTTEQSQDVNPSNALNSIRVVDEYMRNNVTITQFDDEVNNGAMTCYLLSTNLYNFITGI